MWFLVIIFLFLFTVVVGCVAGNKLGNKEQNISPVNPPKKTWYTGDDMQRKFKECYLWASEVFGVSNNVYDDLDAEVKRCPRLGVRYFTYYYASKYANRYPRIQKTVNVVSDEDDINQCERFANEFINIVEGLKAQIDEDELKLFKKYDIYFKNLLTSKFEVDNMKLFSLPS